jgi:hypothetical protein
MGIEDAWNSSRPISLCTHIKLEILDTHYSFIKHGCPGSLLPEKSIGNQLAYVSDTGHNDIVKVEGGFK